MAETIQRNLPAQFIEDLGKDYGKQLTAATATRLPCLLYTSDAADE